MTTTMKAVRMSRLGGPEVMSVDEIAIPEPGPGQLRIKVQAVGLNYSDIMLREGQYINETPLPYTLGREFCGVVEKLGPGAKGFAEGERVLGSVPGGALAEYLCAHPMTLSPLPEGFTPAEGASITIQGITAVHCLQDYTRLKAGETVLIHAAAGGVGTLAIQIAVAMGAKVIGTASSPAKCQLITELGGLAVNYTEGDWVAKVKELNGGRGVDVILESVGGDIFRRSYNEALATFGRMVVYGVAGREVVQISNRDILSSNKELMGYFLGGYYPKHIDRVASGAARLLALIREGKVKPVIGKTYKIEDAIEAFNHMQSRASVGKIIVVP